MRHRYTFVATVTALAAAAAAAGPANGQSLRERLNAVRQEQTREAARQAVEDPTLQQLQKLMYGSVTTRFDETPAREVFEYFRTSLDLNLVVRYLDDAAGHGIDPQQPISLVAEQMPALAALGVVLEQCSAVEPCTWQLRPGFVEVGTKERLSAASARVLRTYPVDDLLFEAPRFEDAPTVGIIYVAPYDGSLGYGGGYNGGSSYGPYGAVGSSASSFSGSISVAPAGSGAGQYDERKAARAQEIIDLILDVVEPEGWLQNGGAWASIAYQDGALVVYAPDFVHRRLVGYPKVPPPRKKPAPAKTPATP